MKVRGGHEAGPSSMDAAPSRSHSRLGLNMGRDRDRERDREHERERPSARQSELGASRTWTPLRENYFEPPLLSSRERAYLVRKSCEAAQELVERARSAGGPIAWHHVEKANGVQVYAGTPRSSNASAAISAASMCGVTSVPGTVKEVAGLFELGSSRQMKEFARAHREYFYDGVVLHTLAPRTREKPLHQVTAKWMVVKTPHGLAHRDFCFLECQDKFIDARGRKGWVLGQHSIKLPGCDDLQRAFGFVRGSLYHSGLVVVESEDRPGHVDVIHLVQLNMKEHTPVPTSFMRARVVFVAQVRNMLRSKRLNEQRYLSDLELVPRKYRARCAVCQDSFSLLLLRKLNCRKCGEVVCAACSKEFPIQSRSPQGGQTDVRKLRVCMLCFQSITNAPKPTSALAEPPHASTAFSLSFLGYHDDDLRASFMTQGPPPANSRRRGGHHQEPDQPPKIFLQSMRRDKPSQQRRMSMTSPIQGYGGGVPPAPPSTARHRTREPNDADYQRLIQQSQRYQQQQERQHRQQQQYQQQDYSQSQYSPAIASRREQPTRQSREVRGSQRMRPSELFRPSESISLDAPMSAEDQRYTMQLPPPPQEASPASIFDRPESNAASSRRQRGFQNLPRANSSNALYDTDADGSQRSNLSRLQQLSSRDRLEQLQKLQMQQVAQRQLAEQQQLAEKQRRERQHRQQHQQQRQGHIPSDYMESLQQAKREKPEFQAPPPVFTASFDDQVDENHALPSPLDVAALETVAPVTRTISTTTSSTPAPLDSGILRRRERVESSDSESSAGSIDIDSYDAPTATAAAPDLATPHEEHASEIESYGQSALKEALMPNSVLAGATAENHGDSDSETSMGASDDEEEVLTPVVHGLNSEHTTAYASPARHHSQHEDEAEETKSHEFSETPPLPPPSPSAHEATREMLRRSSVATSFTTSSVEEDAEEMTDTEAGNFLGNERRLSEVVLSADGDANDRRLSDVESSEGGSEGERASEVVATSAVELQVDDELLERQQRESEELLDRQRRESRELIDRHQRQSELLLDQELRESEDFLEHEQRQSEELSGEEGENADAEYELRDSELLNSAKCDMNYLDADMRQFHDQSLFVRSSRGSRSSLDRQSISSQQLAETVATLQTPTASQSAQDHKHEDNESVITPPYVKTPTSPQSSDSPVKNFNGQSRHYDGPTVPTPAGVVVPAERPPIHREGTFALANMANEQHYRSWNTLAAAPASAGRVLLDGMAPVRADASATHGLDEADRYPVASTTTSESSFAIANTSLLSVPVSEQASQEEDLSFEHKNTEKTETAGEITASPVTDEDDEIPVAAVSPVPFTLPVQDADDESEEEAGVDDESGEEADVDEIIQTSGDEVSESRSRSNTRSRSSSLLSLSSLTPSSRNSRADLRTSMASGTSASSGAHLRSNASSQSSVTSASALGAAASPNVPLTDGSQTNVVEEPPVVSSSSSSSSNSQPSSGPPAYLPARFQKGMAMIPPTDQSVEPPASRSSNSEPMRPSSDLGSSKLDSFQLDFSSSFAVNQERVRGMHGSRPSQTLEPRTSEASGYSDRSSMAVDQERNRASSASSTGSTGTVQVLRYEPCESSVLDTVPDTEAASAVAATSASDTEEDEDADDSEDDMLLSARQLYGRFGNTRKLSLLGGKRPGLERTFSQIQQSFDQLESDSDNDNDDVGMKAPSGVKRR